jgi:hypothetical protein
MSHRLSLPFRSRPALHAALGSAALALHGAPAAAQVVEVDLTGMVFHEPSEKSPMTVYNPGATLAVNATEWLSVNAHWEADIVSGATEPVKAGPLSTPDIISQASIHDTRHVVSGGFALNRKNTTLAASYSYGIENDYRSQAISVSAGTELLQRNTRLELSYARAFDDVCNLGYPPSRHPTLRSPLDSSKGCFTSSPDRQLMDIDVDTFGAAWTQSWTPVLNMQMSLNYQIQHGFLGNPYRGVVIGAGGEVAQEHHPDNRARFAAALKAKYYVRPLATAFGLAVRGYKDTWNLISQTYELSAERHMTPWLRLEVKGRYYDQTGAIFWSDDYTGGEPVFGPRGQYWSGDRELSPLRSYLVGGRVLGGWKGAKGNRLAGMLLDLDTGASLNVIKTDLRDFSLAGRRPDDTWAFVVGLSVHGGF